MSNGLKALLLAASTIITCIIVGLGFMMAREAKQIGNHVIEELHSYRIAVEEQDYIRYDGVIVYGTDVVNLMKKEFSGNTNGIQIIVEDGAGRKVYEKEEDLDAVREIGTIGYIAPTAEYTGEVVRNKNEVIIGLIFREKAKEDKKR